MAISDDELGKRLIGLWNETGTSPADVGELARKLLCPASAPSDELDRVRDELDHVSRWLLTFPQDMNHCPQPLQLDAVTLRQRQLKLLARERELTKAER